MTIALDRLAAEDFEPLAGRVLPARSGDAGFALQVESVQRSAFATARELPGFAVRLLGPREPWIAQGLLAIEHPVHGELVLFATALGRDARGTQYEIVFN